MEKSPCEAILEEIFAKIEERYASLEDFAARVNVPYSFLLLFREGRWESMPEPVYVKGFLKKISDALGMDADTVISAFSQCLEERDVSTSIEDISIKKSTSSYVFRWSLVVFLFGLVAIVAYLVFGAKTFRWSFVKTKEKAVPSANVTVSTVQPPEEVEASQVQTEEKHEEKRVVGGFTVSVTAKDDRSWFRWVGGEKLQGFIEPGTEKNFFCNKTCILKLGKPSAVEVIYKGSKLFLPYKKPVTLEFSEEGVKVLK